MGFPVTCSLTQSFPKHTPTHHFVHTARMWAICSEL